MTEEEMKSYIVLVYSRSDGEEAYPLPLHFSLDHLYQAFKTRYELEKYK